MEELNKIEFTAEDRNIIRFCVEESLKREKSEGDETRAWILEPIYEKLKNLRQKELKNGTSEDSIFL